MGEVNGRHLVRLESGRSRSELTAHLRKEAERDPRLVVGFDFAFSFPRWFVVELGAQAPREVWSIVSERAETWLQHCEPPFWGRPGHSRPDLADHFRKTELHAAGASRPKSVFQVGGAGAVGTGSLRGMPVLLELAHAGFSIWPFDEVRLPLVVEIYPRLLTGPVVKSDPRSRSEYLEAHYPDLPVQLMARAATSEDAFDAAVSALVMAEHATELMALEAASSRATQLEGWIWQPHQADEQL